LALFTAETFFLCGYQKVLGLASDTVVGGT